MQNQTVGSEDFEIESDGRTVLLSIQEAVLLSYYDALSKDVSVESAYPLSLENATREPKYKERRSYEYPQWSSYVDEKFKEEEEKDGELVCCNFCAAFLKIGDNVISCDSCSQMTYCSEKCKKEHKNQEGGHCEEFCEIIRRIEQNCVTKGDLLMLMEEIPKEEDYESPLLTRDSIVYATDVNALTSKTKKEEKRFVQSANVDFDKLVCEAVRIECATCGGNKYDDDEEEKEEKKTTKSKSSSLSSYSSSNEDEDEDDEDEDEENEAASHEKNIKDRIIECNSAPLSQVIVPKFEKLPPLDRKIVLLVNSYLNSLDYDDEVDLTTFDNKEISSFLFETVESDDLTRKSNPEKKEEEEEKKAEHARDNAHIGTFLNLGLGLGPYPYRRRRRYYRPPPVYYGGPYGWRYGRRYRPGIGYYGYYGDPWVGYYGGTYGGRWKRGIRNAIGFSISDGEDENAKQTFDLEHPAGLSNAAIETSVLIKGKTTEAALAYLKRAKGSNGKRGLVSVPRTDANVAFHVSVFPVHVKKSKKEGKPDSLDSNNVPSKKTTITFLNKTTGTKIVRPLPVGKYALEKMIGLHALVLKSFDFYRRRTTDNVIEIPSTIQIAHSVWSDYDGYRITFTTTKNGGTHAQNFAGHFPLDLTYFGKPYKTSPKSKKSIVRPSSEGHSELQRLILTYLVNNGLVKFSTPDVANVSYKQLRNIPFKQCFAAIANPDDVWSFSPSKGKTAPLSYDDIFGTTIEDHFKLTITRNDASNGNPARIGDAIAQLKSLEVVFSNSIFIFDPNAVPESQDDMPKSSSTSLSSADGDDNSTYVGISNVHIKKAAEKHGLPLIVVAHEALNDDNDTNKKKRRREGDGRTVGLVFMLFEWMTKSSKHVLSQFIYLSHEKTLAYKYFAKA